ncbi:MAG: hypothetical protein H6834_17265 [Planctomycetes bacterium]|nr:hypothetical protein [Planctomycetota bacterium]
MSSGGKTIVYRGRDRSGESTFLYALSEDVPVRIRVLGTSDAPVEGAIVTIVDPLDAPGEEENVEDLITGRTYHRGMTDHQGRLEATIRVPIDRFELDVIVNVPGMRGHYTHEELRAIAAEFAPSARIRRSRSYLRNVTVRLEEEL